ncbi:unnamed protein product [Linum tenue]|uniref:TIR domain-containing protein n=1 Tax=Linum tenue TaxID=586396 RepID=A0AAV0QFC1_9ROSI|nr:unnamed protein product [Linum tenue]
MSYFEGASTAADPSDASIGVDSDTWQLPLPSGEYEVFLNFRGPDTRYQITDILYRFLVRLRIRTFLDDENLREGEGIWPNLVEAIEQSKIYVPIFSEDYANSKWCLRELAAIVERQKHEEGCIILPIFYMVNPSDVRHQTGPFKQAFRKRSRSFDERTVQEWRDALSKVGALKGWHVESNDKQGAITDLVYSIIWSHLSKSIYVVETDKLVAIDDHIEAVKERMELDSASVGVVGIHGIGGIGKTTIAKAVYNKISGSFARCSFVGNVRETLEQRDGIISLQKKIISDVMRLTTVEPITSVSDGIRIIRERVSGFKVLIILDDVDEKSKLDEILGKFENFASGSRFIVTSRNVRVLRTFTEDDKLYKVRGMSHTHSLQLFYKHAFDLDSPLPGYETLSSDVVSTTGGLPLTLKVVGSLLYKEDKGFWKEKLAQFQQHTLEEEVVEVLMISYASLNYQAKQIFLDIACFLVGEDKEMASYMWADCGFYPISNVIILLQRSLIEIGDGNQFQMHDQLRDLGINIVHRENVENPLRRSRIWSNPQALELLSREKGPSQVQTLRVNSGSFVAKEMASDCFVNLSELRYLDAEYTMLIGDFSNLLPKMRWFRLHYHRNAGHNKLTNLKMENLTILDLHSSDVPYDCSFFQVAEKLKVIDLTKCYNMTRLPCFPTSGSLEILNLSCLMLRSADLDLGNLSNLKVLLLKGGGVRKITGGTIGVLKQLRELDVTEFRCENLGEALADIGELQVLKHLRASGTDIVATHGTRAGIRLPTSLKELITSSPIANLSELIEMETLVVRDCSYGLEIPPADTMWWKLSKLKSMELYGTRMTTTISLRPFRLLPSTLTRLDISEYWGLDWLPNLENLENLTLLSIHDCPALKEIQGLGGLKSLEILIIERVSLSNLIGLDCLVALKTLEISSCHALRRLPSLASLSNLCKFHSYECPHLVEIQGIEGLESLQVLSIVSEDSLSLLEGLGTLLSFNKLQILQIWGCPCLAALSSHDQQLGGGGGASQLVLHSLQELSIGGSALLLQTSFGQMLHLSKFPRLLELEVWQLEAVDVDKELLLEGLESLEELTRLTLRGLAIQKLPSLSKLQKLEALTVTGASNLREIEGIADLKSLEWLVLSSCTSFETLPEGLSGLKRLRQVNIEGSTNLTCLSALSYLPPNVYVWGPNLL